MKAKTTAAEKPLNAIEQLLAKREVCVAERDAHLSRLMELNADIESLDSVMKMFDPNHVPLDIRRAQGAPVLTLSAQPILAEVAEQVAQVAPEAKPAAAPKATAKATKEAASDGRKPGRPAKPDAASAPPAKASATLSDAVADKVKTKKTKQQSQSNKKVSAAREQVKEYFGDIDKLKTLEDIVKSSSDGVPFRVICEKFAELHPIDVSKKEVKKVFSDRLSALLHGLSQQHVVQRSERQGADGKQENVWLHIRASRNGNGSIATAGAEASAAV